MPKITKSVVNQAAPKETDYFIWDSEVKGYGLKIAKSGRKSYVCKFRTGGGGRNAPTRRMTIGTHGSPWTVDQARLEAKKILGAVANGADPSQDKQDRKKQLTVSALCDLYLSKGISHKKESTIATDRGRIERHIKPLLGNKKINDVTRSNIKQFQQDIADGKTASIVKTKLRGKAVVKGGKGAASRTVGLLGGIFSYAFQNDLVTTNPVHGVKRFPDNKCKRFLTVEEFKRLSISLKELEAEGVNIMALNIIRLLIFAGARKTEMAALKWSEIDLITGNIHFEDSKTGKKSIPINTVVRDILEGMPRQVNSPYVFPASKGNRYYQGMPKVWQVVKKRAGIEDVRIHDLRHTFASVAISSGIDLAVIGGLLGHKDAATTQRYAHLHDNPKRSATDKIAQYIREAM